MNVISSGFFWMHTNGERCFLSQNHAVTASTTRAITSRAMQTKKNWCVTRLTIPSFPRKSKASKRTSVSEMIIIATEALADLFRPGFCTERDESSKSNKNFFSTSSYIPISTLFTHFTFNPFNPCATFWTFLSFSV